MIRETTRRIGRSITAKVSERIDDLNHRTIEFTPSTYHDVYDQQINIAMVK
jgi:hypothetical protein